MKVLSHRGLWNTAVEKNTATAFQRSFDAGFGTETDVRDRGGEMVISHDMPGDHEMSLDAFLCLHGSRELPLAVNIKADGLAPLLHEMMCKHRVADWFAFDMSVPDMRAHLRLGNPVFTRLSDAEPRPVWLDQARGVWLDAFEGDWFGTDDITDLLRAGKRVCVVSPELHGRDPSATWRTLRPLARESALLLCTDRPFEAAEFLAIQSPAILRHAARAPAFI